MGGKSGSVVIGYNYFMDILMAICHVGQNDIVEIKEIEIGGRTMWSGSATSSQTVGVYEPELFGGDKREGGVEGQIDIMMGRSNQPVNPYLGASVRASGITGALPAYRGVLSLFFRGNFVTDAEFPTVTEWSFEGTPSPPPVPPDFWGFTTRPPSPAFMWSGMNPYFKPPRFLVARYPSDWQPALSRIGNDMNAVHIIYEALTNPDWGMGYPTTIIDDAYFTAAAQILFDENFGISLAWSQTTTINDFISFVLLHVSGVMTQSRLTGQIRLKMLRGGYDTESLMMLDPSNSTLISFSRPGLGETVNEVVVNYTNSYGNQDSISAQDLAGVTNQGQVISQAIDLPGIRNGKLAAKVAQRELESRIKPVSKVSMTTDRRAFSLEEGDLFKFSWSDHGIAEAYFRALEIDLGKLDDNLITITAIEDVFGFSNSTYVEPQPIGWVDTIQSPLPAINYRSFELSYYDVITQFSEADREFFTDDTGIGGLMAVKPQTDTVAYKFYRSPNNVDYYEADRADWTPSATITADIGYDDTAITYSNPVGMAGAFLGGLAYLDDELVYVESATNSSAVISRGVIDTVPSPHSALSRLWFIDDIFFGVDRDRLTDGETVYYKYSTVSSRGQLDMVSSPNDPVTMDSRYFRPYPPGRLRINGSAYPPSINGELDITWAHRSRTQQADQIVDNDATSIGPEVGTTYDIVVRGETGTIIHTSNTATTSFTFSTEGPTGLTSPPADRTAMVDAVTPVVFAATPRLNDELTIELSSLRDTLPSQQKHNVTVSRRGWGLRWGESWGG